MIAADRPYGPLPVLLICLAVVTGLVDAFSYLSLGHVFVANMTGNVVFLGFALAGVGESARRTGPRRAQPVPVSSAGGRRRNVPLARRGRSRHLVNPSPAARTARTRCRVACTPQAPAASCGRRGGRRSARTRSRWTSARGAGAALPWRWYARPGRGFGYGCRR